MVYRVQRHCLTTLRRVYWTKRLFTDKTSFTPQICKHDYDVVCTMRKLSYNILLLATMGGILVLHAQPCWAQAVQSVSECDLLAASPLDSTKPLEIPGVAVDAIDSEKAIVACRSAVIAQPNNARIQYQYGRALDKGDRGKLALDVYKKAFELGSYPAANNIGAMLYRGGPKYSEGVIRCQSDVGEWFRASQRGVKSLKNQPYGFVSLSCV